MNTDIGQTIQLSTDYYRYSGFNNWVDIYLTITKLENNMMSFNMRHYTNNDSPSYSTRVLYGAAQIFINGSIVFLTNAYANYRKGSLLFENGGAQVISYNPTDRFATFTLTCRYSIGSRTALNVTKNFTISIDRYKLELYIDGHKMNDVYMNGVKAKKVFFNGQQL